MVGHRSPQTHVNQRAVLVHIRRWMKIGGSNGSHEFRCPAIVQALTHGESGFGTRTEDAWHISNGITCVQFKTTDPVEAVRGFTVGFLHARGPPHEMITAPLIWTLIG